MLGTEKVGNVVGEVLGRVVGRNEGLCVWGTGAIVGRTEGASVFPSGSGHVSLSGLVQAVGGLD